MEKKGELALYRSVEKHNIYYDRFIGDEDSSAY